MVQKDDLTARLLSRFKKLIGQGVIVPGARLPSERDLAAQFGVSRPTLRHALKVLESMGVLHQRVGSGTYLSRSAEPILGNPLEFVLLLDKIPYTQLMDMRLMLEPELAARAAENAKVADLRALAATLDSSLSTIETTVDADILFHQLIYRASGNLLCQRIFSALHRAMISAMLITSQKVGWKHTLSYHRPIFEAIERRQPREARARMAAHLNNAKENLDALVTDVPARIPLADITPIRLKKSSTSE